MMNALFKLLKVKSKDTKATLLALHKHVNLVFLKVRTGILDLSPTDRKQYEN